MYTLKFGPTQSCEFAWLPRQIMKLIHKKNQSLYQVGNQVQSYFTVNLRYEIRHDLVSNLIFIAILLPISVNSVFKVIF